MKHLQLFETKSQHDTVYNGSEYEEPWVAYIEDDELITYNKPHDYSKDYFTIEALENGNVYFKYLSFATTEDQRYIEYSKDNGNTWVRTTNVNGQEVIMTIPLLTGEKALVKGNNDTFSAYNKDEDMQFGSCFYSGIELNVSGNIMSLIYGDDFIGETNVVERMFVNLFYDWWCEFDSGVTANCMVTNAKNLILPAMTLANYCYYNMFESCTSLITAPQLPATTLAPGCYCRMFADCTSLTTAPELPATTLADSCYNSMFSGCTSLITAPEVPVTALANFCYDSMFRDCTSLTTAPELPATTLADSCYQSMFQGCTSLAIAPELPATILATYCYNSMFYGCSSLTSAPVLPATTLAYGCYREMFYGCTSLTTAPELPATTLTNTCYSGMFRECTLLTTAPVLPAITLIKSCYANMFSGCASLNYIKAMFTTTPSSTYTQNWVSGVASTGTFVKNSAATWNVTGVHGIPSGWTVQTASA